MQKQNVLLKKRTSVLENQVLLITSIINIFYPFPLQHFSWSWLHCFKVFGSYKLSYNPETTLFIDPTMQAAIHKIITVANCFIIVFIATTVIKKAITLQAALS